MTALQPLPLYKVLHTNTHPVFLSKMYSSFFPSHHPKNHTSSSSNALCHAPFRLPTWILTPLVLHLLVIRQKSRAKKHFWHTFSTSDIINYIQILLWLAKAQDQLGYFYFYRTKGTCFWQKNVIPVHWFQDSTQLYSFNNRRRNNFSVLNTATFVDDCHWVFPFYMLELNLGNSCKVIFIP